MKDNNLDLLSQAASSLKSVAELGSSDNTLEETRSAAHVGQRTLLGSIGHTVSETEADSNNTEVVRAGGKPHATNLASERLGKVVSSVVCGGTAMLPKAKVIVADDEQAIADTLSIILNQSGFEATAAYSGEEAVEIANIFQPDILVTDVRMPGMTGIEAAILVRERMPSCKIVLLSGQAIAADLLGQAREQGYEFDIVAKPFRPSQLIAHLRGNTALENSA